MELGEDYEEPDLGPDNYMLDAFVRLGFSRNSEGGLEPAPWREILAFSKATLRVSDPGDLEALRAMSAAYIEGLRIGELPLGRAPMQLLDDDLLEVV